jgi:hypothetical protein
MLLREPFEVPTIVAVKKGLLTTQKDTVHWDREIQCLMYSAMAVHGVASEAVRRFAMFEPVDDKTLNKSFKKLLFQATLQDVWELKIDARRLVSWNYGMAILMNLLKQD